MKPQSEAEALALLENSSLSNLERKEAIHYLAENLNPPVVRKLVDTLEDHEFSIRWAAAKALAHAGEQAWTPVLRKLVAAGGDGRVREVAHHVLNKNASTRVQKESQNLLKAMKGPAADMATPQAAYELLREIE